jgi:tetratricopeptide (TPR) repeat protein
MRRLLALTAIAAVAATTTYVVGASDGTRDRPASPGPATAALAALEPANSASTSETDRLIAAYEQIAHRVSDTRVDGMLATLYLQRAKLTGDVATYGQSLDAARLAVHLAPHDSDARIALANARYSVHDFAAAASDATAALRTDPRAYGAAAVLGDCYLETGRYADAQRIYESLDRDVSNSPGVAIRLARLAWVTGHPDRALSLAVVARRDAVASGAYGTGLAFYDVFLAQLSGDLGRYDDAVRYAATAVRAAPRWHVALAASGRALAQDGRFSQALAAYRHAVAIVPQPDYLAATADLETLTGHVPAATSDYATIDAIRRLATANRQIYNRQLVLIAADHGTDVAAAVTMALAELHVRADGGGYDAAAWALHADGQDTRAAALAATALRINPRDPRFLWHAGAIAASLGQPDRAVALIEQALSISPHFDPLQAQRAKLMLDQLRGRR